MKKFIYSLFFSIFFSQICYANYSIINAAAENYNYTHKHQPNSNASKTYVSCNIKEKIDLYSNEITGRGIKESIFNFSFDTNKQVFYKGENLEKVFLFDDDRIIFMTLDNKQTPALIRFNIIHRKTGAYESYYVEHWNDKNYTGKGLGTCIKATKNKF